MYKCCSFQFCIVFRYLKTYDFELISNKICELFPEETPETYYIPRTTFIENDRKKIINAKGKLVDKYRNLKRLYKVTQGTDEAAASTTSLPPIGNASITYVTNYVYLCDMVM